jgi:prepilin-type N-terminal cleavage/methylation domain-containing protein
MKIRAKHHFRERLQCGRRAFTLIEMLVVLIIIAILAALALPAIRGALESRAIDAASQQLLEDISLARQKAISTRSVVALVFISDAVFNNAEVPAANADAEEAAAIKRLKAGAFTHYAFYQFRRVGEQPGQSSAGYISEWKTLPDKTFFATNKAPSVMDLSKSVRFPFPFTRSGAPPSPIQPYFPYIAFDATGRSVEFGNSASTFDIKPTGDRDISIARGAVFYARDPATGDLINNIELQEIPPLNATQNVIHVDGLTGKGQWVKPKPE